jgi:hypothetical protein
MKAFIIGKLRCCFCKGKYGLLSSVHGHGIYSSDIGQRIFYHDECLVSVTEHPERYGHSNVDMAIQIVERKKKNIRVNESIISDHNKNIKDLQHYHFEKMLPGHGKE